MLFNQQAFQNTYTLKPSERKVFHAWFRPVEAFLQAWVNHLQAENNVNPKNQG
jgi:hypothetical protein